MRPPHLRALHISAPKPSRELAPRRRAQAAGGGRPRAQAGQQGRWPSSLRRSKPQGQALRVARASAAPSRGREEVTATTAALHPCASSSSTKDEYIAHLEELGQQELDGLVFVRAAKCLAALTYALRGGILSSRRSM